VFIWRTVTVASAPPCHAEANIVTSHRGHSTFHITNIDIQPSTMSDATEQPKKERFAPKQPVTLNPPKDDVIERDYLAKCDGTASP
jgi:hypothetical protein